MTIPHRRAGRAQARRGLSILEFLGCFAALAGGVVLGSMYLGVDVKEMAYVVLEQAQLVEPHRVASNQSAKPAEANPVAGDSAAAPGGDPASASARPAGTTPETSSTMTDSSDSAATSDAEDAVAQKTPTEAAPADPPAALPTPAAGLFAREDLITPEQRHALTLGYWEALAVCMQNEVTQRVPAIDSEGNWQLFDYLNGRKEGHGKAADAIAALDPRGVDEHVLAYAKKAYAWHEDGAKLFARAVDLLTDAPTAQLSGPFAQSWQSAATQHRMESRLLVEKEQAVRTYLDHAYEPAAAPATEPAGN